MLLTEGINKKQVILTEYTRKLTINGHTQAYPIYRVRLDQLYYNDRNDRIATWINKYKEENKLSSLDSSDTKYNDIIQGFIKKSNPQAINKTKSNIELVGQREAGVVLSDGRIIDGNRRFTCLRMIEDETSKPQYIEVVILDREYEDSEKEIKLLELAIQHGEEERVDYNPIDKLVGLYQDVVKNKLISLKEYSVTTNESETKLKNKIELAELMVEFLEFIEAPNKFYIARDLELDGSLNEIPSLLKKCKTDEEREDMKLIIFSQLLMKPHSSMPSHLRKVKNVIESNYAADFVEEQLGFVEDTVELIAQASKMTPDYINKSIRNNDDLKHNMKASVDKFEIKTKKELTRIKPLHDLERCSLYLENVISDENIVRMMNESDKEAFQELARKCERYLEDIKVFIN